METFNFVIIFVCMFSSVLCDGKTCDLGSDVRIQEYGVYLIAVSMIFMLLVIIGLSIALYMVTNNKAIFGISLNTKPVYFRQESTQGVTICNVTSTHTLNDTCRNDGSTLTVNSGIVEISGLSEPETPTRSITRDETKPPCFKKAVGPTISTMQKEQMDNIIKQVLMNRKHKRESETYRELDALTNAKPVTEKESHSPLPKRSVSSDEFDNISQGEPDESLYQNTSEIKDNFKHEIKNKPMVKSDTVLDRAKNSEMKLSVEDEQEVYDTVPSPVRCPDSGMDDGYIENLPVYDLPPRRSWDRGENSNVVMDNESDYLLLLSKQDPGSQDKASYINAKRVT